MNTKPLPHPPAEAGGELGRVAGGQDVPRTREAAAGGDMCRDAAKRQFDLVMAWSVDRLGRSLQDLVGFLSELHALRIDLFLHQQGLDTMTPAGKAMFQMMGVFAVNGRSFRNESAPA